MASILILGRKNPAKLVRILMPVERLANRVLVKLKKDPLKPWAANLVDELGDAAGRIAHNPQKAVFVFLFSFLASSCELTCFILCGIAFGVNTLPALIGGYVIATLLAMISFTPQGVGFVEVGVLALMAAYGVDTAAGTAVALVYRGLVFWMPFIIGAVLINMTKSFSKGRKQVAEHVPSEEGALVAATDSLTGTLSSKLADDVAIADGAAAAYDPSATEATEATEALFDEISDKDATAAEEPTTTGATPESASSTDTPLKADDAHPTEDGARPAGNDVQPADKPSADRGAQVADAAPSQDANASAEDNAADADDTEKIGFRVIVGGAGRRQG